jgi:hypothetical protein
MATRAVSGGAFESDGRSYDVTVALETGVVEIVEYRGISGDIVVRASWDADTARVLDPVVVDDGWSGDLPRLIVDAAERLRREPPAPS